MKINWKVSHFFSEPVGYESGPIDYPTLGVHFVIDNSEIRQVDHEFTADDSSSRADVARLSAQQLNIIWEQYDIGAGIELK